MSKRIVVCLSAFAAAALIVSTSRAAPLPEEGKVKPPKWVYAQGLLVRAGGVSDYDGKTRRIGVEFFLDSTNGSELALSENGALAVTPMTSIGSDTRADWLTAHDMRVRKAGELTWTQKTKQYGVEVFKDAGSKMLLYVSEAGGVAFAPMPPGVAAEKGPKWHHALEPKVRGPEEETFANAKKFGVEVFKDENTGGLIYITENGAIAAAPAPPKSPDKAKIAAPKPLYGLVLRVRGSTEINFSDKTKKVGVEVFEDPNTNVLFFISGAGYIATAPKPAKLTGTRGVTWKGAMNLKARKGGEKGFDKAARFGIEVFADNQTGYTIYVCESGSIAVLPTKSES